MISTPIASVVNIIVRNPLGKRIEDSTA